MFEKLLIANRGEIAVRIARTCREVGIPTVAVYSTADTDGMHARYCDEAICIGPPPSKKSYQSAAAIIEAARKAGADAVHPGYGFLSEDPDFAEICAEAGLTFIGPSPGVLELLGDKSTVRARMSEAGLPLLPGTVNTVSNAEEGKQAAAEIGYPVILKAAAGGGGRGMRVVWRPADFVHAFGETRAAALAVFGDDRLYVERYLENARHIEVQFMFDAEAGVHLNTRDCTVQRRHQKLIEEAPAPSLSPETTNAICAAALRGVGSLGYVNVGTAEFLLDEHEQFYFMEINGRIQVEHPVTEMTTQVDLVYEQLHIAAGGRLRFSQDELRPRGHAIECRVNAEDPTRDFVPTPGVLTRFLPPAGPFTRVDSHGFPGCRIGPEYDSMVAKVAVWAPDRDAAISRVTRALYEFDVGGDGVATTIPFLLTALSSPDFRKASHSTRLVESLLSEDKPQTGVTAANERSVL
jgi:acetyl-CoA carboxylase biotin carboxylase subunit